MVKEFMANFETTEEIERVVGNFFRPRQNIVVPNVGWGLDIHECDLFVLTKNGYGIEIEIKTNKADLIRDKKKRHQHNNEKIKKLFFAIPEKLNTLEIVNHIPLNAGIIEVDTKGRCQIIRPAISNSVQKLDDNFRTMLLRLAYLRYWNNCCAYYCDSLMFDDGMGI